MTDFLTIQKLSKDYDGRKALRDVSFSLQKGDCLTIFGPNGAGKSTLLRILATLTLPSTGRVVITGIDIQEEPELLKMQLGFISHHSLLYDHMTALENLTFYGELYKVEDPVARAEELLKMMELYPRRHSRVEQFSRGMSQRLSIARALVNDPSLVLLDEPFSGLDQYASAILTEQLHSLRNRERTVIMVTHNLDRGLEIATKVGVLAGGHLAYLEECRNIDRMVFEESYPEYTHGVHTA